MTDRLIIGQRSADEYGFFLSKPTKSVWSTNPDDFLLTTSLGSVAQTFMKGTVVTLTIMTPNVSTTWDTSYTLTHNLGYVPVVWSTVVSDRVATVADCEEKLQIDATTIIFRTVGSATTTKNLLTTTFNYIIFATPAL